MKKIFFFITVLFLLTACSAGQDFKEGAIENVPELLAGGDQPIAAANVRFEIWQENDAKHEFIETKETSPGTYSADYAFPAIGHFIVKIHVEKGNIHDHPEKSIEVNLE